jgi:hypothetical protein
MTIADAEGACDRAHEVGREALGLYAAEAVDAQETVGLRADLAEYELLLGRPDAAVRTLASAYDACRKGHDHDSDAFVLRAAAGMALARGEVEFALMLFGAFERLRGEGTTEMRTRVQVERDRASLDAARGVVGEEAASRAMATGRATDGGSMLDKVGDWLAQLNHRGVARLDPPAAP